MIVKRTWERYKRPNMYFYTGWFLFGFIPIYINRENRG